MMRVWPQNISVKSIANLLDPPGNRSADLQESEIDVITTWRHCMFWHSLYVFWVWTWGTYISNVWSIQTILFDILDCWRQLVVIRFVETLSKRCMFVSFMKISACWLLHRLIKFYKICWEKRPAKPRPNLRTSFCRRDLKNTQPHLNSSPPQTPSWSSGIFLFYHDKQVNTHGYNMTHLHA